MAHYNISMAREEVSLWNAAPTCIRTTAAFMRLGYVRFSSQGKSAVARGVLSLFVVTAPHGINAGGIYGFAPMLIRP